MESQPNTTPAIKLTGQMATEAKLTLEALQRYGELYAVPCEACDLLDLGILEVQTGQQVAAGAIATFASTSASHFFQSFGATECKPQ